MIRRTRLFPNFFYDHDISFDIVCDVKSLEDIFYRTVQCGIVERNADLSPGIHLVIAEKKLNQVCSVIFFSTCPTVAFCMEKLSEVACAEAITGLTDNVHDKNDKSINIARAVKFSHTCARNDARCRFFFILLLG